MKIACCLIIKNENEYLGEWLGHHTKIGIDNFIIYDNNSTNSVRSFLRKDEGWYPNVEVIDWKDEEFRSQSRAYLDCAKKFKQYDYMGFLDSDELYQSKTMNIKQDIKDLEDKYGKFDALGLYWRMYGANPYIENPQPMSEYKQWYKHHLIKSFINPKVILDFPNPHKATIVGKYINEFGQNINGPIGTHSSENIWIKHVWCKSLPEWKQKIERGDANIRKVNRTMNDFYNHTAACLNNDNEMQQEKTES